MMNEYDKLVFEHNAMLQVLKEQAEKIQKLNAAFEALNIKFKELEAKIRCGLLNY